MNLLLAEVAQATQRLADAGVPSPRNDAEELAAFVHGVELTHWNGIPVARAVALEGERSRGANDGARRALGVMRLSCRSRLPTKRSSSGP